MFFCKLGGITDEVAEYYMDIMRDIDLTIFGKTYELLIPYWPDVANRGCGASLFEMIENNKLK